ncbi:unnamed protein product [Darwinula stevensoni]|uniref:Cuticle protein n=1 Tax=Darwinula stevensoni TaxID=69355 RepID=A0A7R8X8U1_9CRUS|nr:unnamed protein product [Darwinula stevensoni]CAG0883789.1 unnamed protein product [Darwinula stevensoni]
MDLLSVFSLGCKGEETTTTEETRAIQYEYHPLPLPSSIYPPFAPKRVTTTTTPQPGVPSSLRSQAPSPLAPLLTPLLQAPALGRAPLFQVPFLNRAPQLQLPSSHLNKPVVESTVRNDGIVSPLFQNQFHEQVRRIRGQQTQQGVSPFASQVHQGINRDATIPVQPEAATRNNDSKVDDSPQEFPPQPYDFGFKIRDGVKGASQEHQETKDGDGVKGSYSYEDGNIRRTVHYVADKDGFRVTNEEIVAVRPLAGLDGTAEVQSAARIAGTQRFSSYVHVPKPEARP